MAGNWRNHCRSPGLKVDGNDIIVTLSDDREHRVTVTETDDCYLLTATVARARLVAVIENAPLHVWLRNREARLAGFRIDRRNNILAEASVPTEGLSAAEFRLYVRSLAIESDRFEFSLTGRDAE